MENFCLAYLITENTWKNTAKTAKLTFSINLNKRIEGIQKISIKYHAIVRQVCIPEALITEEAAILYSAQAEFFDAPRVLGRPTCALVYDPYSFRYRGFYV